jgi:hypothetical protein
MGPSQCPPSPGPTQDADCPFRRRRCLLKGCERPFQPTHYQDRYCSAACRLQAARWRRWHSAQKYRSSEVGKQCRRAQSRRYRKRCRQRRAARWEQTLRIIEARWRRKRRRWQRPPRSWSRASRARASAPLPIWKIFLAGPANGLAAMCSYRFGRRTTAAFLFVPMPSGVASCPGPGVALALATASA